MSAMRQASSVWEPPPALRFLRLSDNGRAGLKDEFAAQRLCAQRYLALPHLQCGPIGWGRHPFSGTARLSVLFAISTRTTANNFVSSCWAMKRSRLHKLRGNLWTA
ncbi:hypothetical protein AGR1A_pAt20046 [Agrobacterium fabacearum CFBP 5771]|nr:hypothetical protein AGR1A_pAt20046 [Agrobacterium fabacearum CFBP 5771]